MNDDSATGDEIERRLRNAPPLLRDDGFSISAFSKIFRLSKLSSRAAKRYRVLMLFWGLGLLASFLLIPWQEAIELVSAVDSYISGLYSQNQSTSLLILFVVLLLAPLFALLDAWTN